MQMVRMELKLDRARFDRCIVRWIKQVQAKQQVGQRLNSKKLIDNGIHNYVYLIKFDVGMQCVWGLCHWSDLTLTGRAMDMLRLYARTLKVVEPIAEANQHKACHVWNLFSKAPRVEAPVG